jgi:hypothetical protein
MPVSRRQLVFGGPLLLVAFSARTQQTSYRDVMSQYFDVLSGQAAAWRLGRLCAEKAPQDQLITVLEQVRDRLSCHVCPVPTPASVKRKILYAEIKRDFQQGSCLSIGGLALSWTEVALLFSFYSKSV